MNQSNEFFKETQTILSLKQPLFGLLSMNRKNLRLCQGLYNCNNKNCRLCALYIKPWTSFKTSNNELGILGVTYHVKIKMLFIF